MRRALRIETIGPLAGIAAIAMACGLQVTGALGPDGDDAAVRNGSDAAAASDASALTDSEGVSSDAASSTDAPLDAQEAGPPLLTYGCNGTQVSSCAQCSQKTLGCIYCAQDGGPKLTGLCIPRDQGESSLCFNTTPQGSRVCPCNHPNASMCPVTGQACRDYNPNYCTTCGDPNSDGSPCKGGGLCDRASGTCQ